MGLFYYCYNTHRRNRLETDLVASTSSSIVFSNASEYQPFFFFTIPNSQDERKFFVSCPQDVRNGIKFRSNKYIYKYVHNVGDSAYIYKRYGVDGGFEIRQYFCMHHNTNNNDSNVMYSLCAATPMIDIIMASDRSHAGFIPDIDNPRSIVQYKVRNNVSLRLSGDSWRSVESNFLEFWINEKLHPKNRKTLLPGYRQDVMASQVVAELMALKGVKVLYKSQEEINGLYYRPKVSANSIEMLNNWKKNLTEMTVKALCNSYNL